VSDLDLFYKHAHVHDGSFFPNIDAFAEAEEHEDLVCPIFVWRLQAWAQSMPFAAYLLRPLNRQNDMKFQNKQNTQNHGGFFHIFW
jgi:hypothetical protein